MAAYTNNPYDKYKNTQIQTATPGQLILLLYVGAVKFCKLAKKSIEDNDIMQANKYIIRIQDIINELMVSLDMKAGGDIAQNLYSLYDYMLRKLVDANLKKDINQLDEVEKMIDDLKESWSMAVKKTGGLKRR